MKSYSIKLAIEERLNKELTENQWAGVQLLLDLTEPFHYEEADLDYDIIRIRKLLKLLEERG